MCIWLAESNLQELKFSSLGEAGSMKQSIDDIKGVDSLCNRPTLQ